MDYNIISRKLFPVIQLLKGLYSFSSYSISLFSIFMWFLYIPPLFKFYYAEVIHFCYCLNYKILCEFIVKYLSNVDLKILPHQYNINFIYLLIIEGCHDSRIFFMHVCVLCVITKIEWSYMHYSATFFPLTIYFEKLSLQYIRPYLILLKACYWFYTKDNIIYLTIFYLINT